MKRSFLFLACAALLWTCVRDPLPEQPAEGAEETARFTVEEARTFVTGKLATTRTTPVTRSEADSLTSAWYEFFCFDGLTPQWEHAITGEAYGLDYVEAPFDLPYRYLQAVWDERDFKGADDIWINITPRFYPVPVRLHILRDPETNATAAYLCFYVPDKDFAEEFAGLDERKWAYPCSLLFSGMQIFTELDGELVSAYKFERGKCLYGYDVLSISSEDWTRLEHLVSSIYMARVPSARTRADDPPLNGKDLDPVVIRPKPPIPKPEEEPKTDDDPEEDDNKNKPTRPARGGGGASNNNNTSSDNTGSDSIPKQHHYEFEFNERLKYDEPKIDSLLRLLAADCFGRAVIESLKTDCDITIIMAPDSTRNFTHLSADIKPDGSPMFTALDITVKDDRSYLLLEELMHIAQHMRTPCLHWTQEKLNMEVEAKLGWYVYCQRVGLHDLNWKHLFGGAGEKPYMDMMYTIDRSAERQPPIFYDAFRLAVRSLKNTRSLYADEILYQFDETKMEMTTLKTLIIDC